VGLKTYDPKEVHIIVGGFEMVGLADGTFLTVSRTNDAYAMVVGADGEASRAKSNDKSGNAVLSLQQTSPSNDILSGFAIADELSNSGVIPVIVTDSLGTTTLFSGEGWIKKIPDAAFAKEISNREWTIELASIDIFLGGNS